MVVFTAKRLYVETGSEQTFSLIPIRATDFAVYSSKTTSGNTAERTTAPANISPETGADAAMELIENLK